MKSKEIITDPTQLDKEFPGSTSGYGDRISSIDTRYEDNHMEEIISRPITENNIVVENKLPETFGQGEGPLTRDDIDKVLSYLSTIASNTSSSDIRMTHSSNKRKGGQNEEKPVNPGKGDNTLFPNSRGNNNNTTTNRNYNRVLQISRGRRN